MLPPPYRGVEGLWLISILKQRQLYLTLFANYVADTTAREMLYEQ